MCSGNRAQGQFDQFRCQPVPEYERIRNALFVQKVMPQPFLPAGLIHVGETLVELFAAVGVEKFAAQVVGAGLERVEVSAGQRGEHNVPAVEAEQTAEQAVFYIKASVLRVAQGAGGEQFHRFVLPGKLQVKGVDVIGIRCTVGKWKLMFARQSGAEFRSEERRVGKESRSR